MPYCLAPSSHWDGNFDDSSFVLHFYRGQVSGVWKWPSQRLVEATTMNGSKFAGNLAIPRTA